MLPGVNTYVSLKTELNYPPKVRSYEEKHTTKRDTSDEESCEQHDEFVKIRVVILRMFPST
mgnify:FL=1